MLMLPVSDLSLYVKQNIVQTSLGSVLDPSGDLEYTGREGILVTLGNDVYVCDNEACVLS